MPALPGCRTPTIYKLRSAGSVPKARALWALCCGIVGAALASELRGLVTRPRSRRPRPLPIRRRTPSRLCSATQAGTIAPTFSSPALSLDLYASYHGTTTHGGRTSPDRFETRVLGEPLCGSPPMQHHRADHIGFPCRGHRHRPSLWSTPAPVPEPTHVERRSVSLAREQTDRRGGRYV